MKKTKSYVKWLLPLVLLIVITACGKKEESKPKYMVEPYKEQQFLMGTYVNVQIFDEGKKDVIPKVYDRIKELDKKITVNKPGSEVDKINKEAGIKPVKVSDDVYDLIKDAIKYSKESKGGFDLTIGPITQLWHIGFDDARKPEQTEIDRELKFVDYHKVILDDKAKTVYLEEKGMELDLGAIAKGYITDEAVDVLKENDVTSAIVDLGGNVYVLGDSPRGKTGDWRVGIQDPNEARNTVVGSVTEKNKSIVTSGIYERNLEVDGKLYHHLFNGKTGYPFDNEIAGVTIISETSIAGDGLSTAVFSMGVKEGLNFVENRKDIEAIFVTKNDDIYLSSGIQDNFKFNEESHYKVKKSSELKQ
ncbi:FAD:protein FMN transferase [Vagococcus vulneris]|uniref:FAD:protein FMN transferase n=1 Tax=Vagococcus vulneris TaxID=1977869 RepID=A0A429ZUI1_9ENTE|nr:FAD:protein FMN transferase [Vagococcus vulneris]RST97391.1 thiamine biosynthesis protein ApbE [Vagococcus vulneris]